MQNIVLILSVLLVFIACVSLAVFIYRYRHSHQTKSSPSSSSVQNKEAETNSQEFKLKVLDGLKRELEVQGIPGQTIHFRFLATSHLLELIIRIQVINNNPYPLTVTRIMWDLWMTGYHIKTGIFTDKSPIAENSKRSDFEFREVIMDAQIADALLVNKDATGYLEGAVYFETSYGRIEKKFTLLNLGFTMSKEARDQVKTVNEESELDNLSGMYPRKFIENNLQSIIEKNVHDEPLSFIMIDIDNFKLINDQYGHLIGDDVIRKVCQEIRLAVDTKGFCIRYGGDEFSIVLPNCASQEARALAERIRYNVEQTDFRINDHPLTLTVSSGVATIKDKVDFRMLIKFADDVLRLSKQSGKNKVSVNLRSIRENLPPEP
jgi:diguanylate cyclase (GGDEF)-like protein